ncbi:MAG TPA: hypothetical protein VE889_07390 [Actinomycetota bacterium]|jgi:hypothetical protein|nr:hypothetical protein [Actinomycetota bacterium]
MASKLLRTIGLGAIGALALWWARAAAHSKVPPPEGRWRELDLKDG